MLIADALKKLTDPTWPKTGKSLSGLAFEIGLHERFFFRVSKGRGVNVRNADRALEWFSEHWPEGVEWPREIMRPRLARAAE